MRKYRVLHVVWGFTYGGVETMLVNIIDYQIKKGYEVGLLIVNKLYDDSLIDSLNPQTKVRKIDRPIGSKNIWHLLKINIFSMLYRAEVVHFHFIALQKLFFFKSKARWINTLHTTKLPIGYKKYFRRYDVYTGISKTVVDVIRQYSPNIEPKLCYNGIDLNRIKYSNPSNKLKKIICVGRINFEIKGQDIIIEAFDRLNRKVILNDVELDFVGTGVDTQNLEDLINKRNLNGYVYMLGEKTNQWILDNLHTYDLFVQASTYEGFGLTAVEAMAAGTPVLLSNVEGHLEVSKNGEICQLFESENSLDLSKKIEQVINNYVDGTKNVRIAREYVISNFSIEKLIKELDEIYFN